MFALEENQILISQVKLAWTHDVNFVEFTDQRKIQRQQQFTWLILFCPDPLMCW